MSQFWFFFNSSVHSFSQSVSQIRLVPFYFNWNVDHYCFACYKYVGFSSHFIAIWMGETCVRCTQQKRPAGLICTHELCCFFLVFCFFVRIIYILLCGPDIQNQEKESDRPSEKNRCSADFFDIFGILLAVYIGDHLILIVFHSYCYFLYFTISAFVVDMLECMIALKLEFAVRLDVLFASLSLLTSY